MAAQRASTLEAQWPQINLCELCVGLQTHHSCTRAGPHARAGVANRPSSDDCCRTRAWANRGVAAATAAESDVLPIRGRVSLSPGPRLPRHGLCDEGPNYRSSIAHSSNTAGERRMNSAPAICGEQMAEPPRGPNRPVVILILGCFLFERSEWISAFF